MAQRNQSKFVTDREVDDPLEQDANYEFDRDDRQYIDNQIRGMQQFLVDETVELPETIAVGDLLYVTSTGALARIPVGSEGSTLKVVSGLPAWVAGILDPATLTLTGYWRNPGGTLGSAITDPWPGTASAGSSSGRPLTIGALPNVGASFGTHPSADFNGSGHYLVLGSSLKLSDLLSRPAYFAQVIFEADTAAAPAANPYDDELLLGENGGNFYIGFSTSGVRAGHYDDVSFKVTPAVACSTGAKHCAQVWYDGTNVSCRVDGGAPQTVAAGQVTTAITTLIPRVGASFNAGAFFDGRIAQILTAQSVLTSTQRDQLYAAAQADYAVP